MVIITETDSNDDIIYWSKSCRENKIKLIVSTVNGLFARIMNDFGEEFIVIDKDGEEMQDQ